MADLHPNTSLDYLSLDWVESITHQQGRLGQTGPQTVIRVAKRRAMTKAEVMASGGAYTREDVNWHLPVLECPQGFAPMPGDTITDSEEVHWTVLERAWNKVRQTWRLTTRNLALAYRLSEKIDIERADIRQDAAGGTIRLWPPHGGKVAYEQILARVQPQTTQRVEERGIRDVETIYQVILDRQVVLTGQDRIKWVDAVGDVHYLDITALRNPERLDELPVLDARKAL